VLISSRCFRL